jgi:hypothetical protein
MHETIPFAKTGALICVNVDRACLLHPAGLIVQMKQERQMLSPLSVLLPRLS